MTSATAPTPDPLPCPFCGGPASAREVNPKEAPGWVRLTVVHTSDCFSRAPKEALLLSAADLERWNRRAELEARKPLPPTDMTVTQHVNALVGDGLTAQKVEAICEREPYDVTGVVLSLPDGRACIVNQSAVRWFHGPRDFWNVLHPDAAPSPLIASREVVADGPVRVTRLHLTEEGRAALTSMAAGPLPGITGGSS